MDPSSPSTEESVAAASMASLLKQVGVAEYGYRLQGLAAHVLLRLGWVVTEINAIGHPDISASRAGRAIRLEVECDTGGHACRQPALADLEGLRPLAPGDSGYFAFFSLGPRVRWLLVPVELLERRRNPIPIATIAALAELSISLDWTRTMVSLLMERHRNVWSYSYRSLRRRALGGDSL